MYGATFWGIFFLVAAFLFILPTLIGLIRGVDNMLLVIFLNVLGLATLGVGWIAAMVVACSWERSLPPRRVRRADASVRQPPKTYDPGRFRGTPFEAAARAGLWAEYSDSAPSKR